MSNNRSSSSKKSGITFKPQDAIAYALTVITTSVPTDAEKASFIQVISEKLQLELPASQFSPEVIAAMATRVYEQAAKQRLDKQQTDIALSRVSPAAMDQVSSLIADNAASLWGALQANPDGLVFELGTDPIVDLMIAITAHALVNFHASEWIRYDKRDIFALANLSKLPCSAQEELMQDIHTLWNFNMRVIGSNQPIPCYNAPWLVSIPTPYVSIFHNLETSHVAATIRAKIKELQNQNQNQNK